MISYIRRILSRLIAPQHKLRCSSSIWKTLTDELRMRGEGIREAGAFILGKVEPDGRRLATHIVFYDDLDKSALRGGYVCMTPEGYSKLWNICSGLNNSVIADVHTHPGIALQSLSDKKHPMIIKSGHIAMIIPNFAKDIPISLKTLGMFEYQGMGKWRTLSNYQNPKPFILISKWI